MHGVSVGGEERATAARSVCHGHRCCHCRIDGRDAVGLHPHAGDSTVSIRSGVRSALAPRAIVTLRFDGESRRVGAQVEASVVVDHGGVVHRHSDRGRYAGRDHDLRFGASIRVE